MMIDRGETRSDAFAFFLECACFLTKLQAQYPAESTRFSENGQVCTSKM
jgi:hypothetical protein